MPAAPPRLRLPDGRWRVSANRDRYSLNLGNGLRLRVLWEGKDRARPWRAYVFDEALYTPCATAREARAHAVAMAYKYLAEVLFRVSTIK